MTRRSVESLTAPFALHEMVEALVKRGLARSVAEKAARRELKLPTAEAAQAQADALKADAVEDAHLERGDKLVRALGGRVYRLSQKRASKQSLGLPDRIYVLARRGKWYTWEAKASWGRLSEAQQTYAADAALLGMPHVVGEYDVLVARLVVDGVIWIDPESGIEFAEAGPIDLWSAEKRGG